MQSLFDLPALALHEALPWIFSFALITALELLLPRGDQPLGARCAGVLFWAIWLPVMGVTAAGFRMLWSYLGIGPVIVLPVPLAWAGPLALLLGPVMGSALYDFFFYWFHRAQHRWLWRWHAVHHAIEDLSAVNAYHHISEPVFQSLFVLLPASLFMADTGYLVPAMAVALHLHAAFIHSPARLHLGPLRAIFCDNRFHRIHHSLEQRHFDRNFGAFTTLWDRLFGTAHFPSPEEWPDVGLAGIGQPGTLGAWLALPYRLEPAPEAVEPVAPAHI